MERLDYCYHTHTYRCGHAYGEDEEYVIQAINAGIKRLGFSDHIFLPNFSQPRIRGDYGMLDNYLNSINYLKEQYKDQIGIVVGFEAEYAPSYVEYYKYLLSSKKIDYLILGQHFKEDRGNLRYFIDCEEYVNTVIEGIKTGLFTYLAHPDLFVMFGRTDWLQSYEKPARKLIKACVEYNIPLEINVGGLISGRYYPCDEFFDIVSEYNAAVVIGIDAHTPEQFNKEDIKKAMEFAKKHHLKLKDLFISRAK